MTKHSANTVAVFGATSGIAVAVARQYAQAGCRLVLVGRDLPALQALAADLDARGAAETAIVPADFDPIEHLPALAQQAWDRFGGLDVALIAYGTMSPQHMAEQDPAVAAAMLETNFISPAILVNELANRFETQRRGAIAVLTSVAGDRGRKSNYVYGAAKGGLQRLLEGVRHRLSSAGVAVVDIRPGFVRTKMTMGLNRRGPLWAMPDQVAADIIAATASGRAVCYTPSFWRPVMLVIRAIPRFVFHRTNF